MKLYPASGMLTVKQNSINRERERERERERNDRTNSTCSTALGSRCKNHTKQETGQNSTCCITRDSQRIKNTVRNLRALSLVVLNEWFNAKDDKKQRRTHKRKTSLARANKRTVRGNSCSSRLKSGQEPSCDGHHNIKVNQNRSSKKSTHTHTHTHREKEGKTERKKTMSPVNRGCSY